MADRKDLTKISPGERLWIERKALGRTQAMAAEIYKVSERRYNAMERDMVPVPAGWGDRGNCMPVAALCALARRRNGRPLRTVAESFGISHVTLLTWERAGEPRLVRAWERKGYKF